MEPDLSESSAAIIPSTPERAEAAGPMDHCTPFESLRREIDRLFDGGHSAGGRTRPARVDAAVAVIPMARDLAPAVDVVATDRAYVVTVELPDTDAGDFVVELSNGVLSIAGEKKEQRRLPCQDYVLSERRYGTFGRAVRLPGCVDADDAIAHFARGVLTICLPKSDRAHPAGKRIAVTVG